jgi:3-phenylpropionate/cinnamic acid dioxygenase small subunit
MYAYCVVSNFVYSETTHFNTYLAMYRTASLYWVQRAKSQQPYQDHLQVHTLA